MKLQSLLLSLAVSSVHAAPTLESLRSLDLPAMPAVKFERPPQKEPFFLNPDLAPILKDKALGPDVARVALAAQLDRHRSLVRLRFGARDWDVSIAGDAGFSRYYLTLRDGADLRFAPLGDINRLRGDGIDVAVEPGVVYNLKLSVNILNPVRGSTLNFKPVRGTSGPSHAVKSGALLDAVKARSTVFSDEGKEYWALYGTDVDPATGGLARTRSFLFVHMDGLSSKAWPLAEAALTPGQPYRVNFKSTLALTRTESELVVSKPR